MAAPVIPLKILISAMTRAAPKAVKAARKAGAAKKGVDQLRQQDVQRYRKEIEEQLKRLEQKLRRKQKEMEWSPVMENVAESIGRAYSASAADLFVGLDSEAVQAKMAELDKLYKEAQAGVRELEGPAVRQKVKRETMYPVDRLSDYMRGPL